VSHPIVSTPRQAGLLAIPETPLVYWLSSRYLKDRIRCRWKDEEKDGRPGPYAPDVDDGVKVNIRPFQENGLLAVKQVIKKW